MEKNINVKIMGVFASILLLFIVITASFAYFGSFDVNLNNNVAVNINAVSPGDATFISNATQLNLQVPAANMSYTAANNAIAAKEDTAFLDVTLTGSSNLLTTCTYDIVYEYDAGSNVYGQGTTTKTSGATKEITIEVNGMNGNNHFATERNFDHANIQSYYDSTNKYYKLVEGATIKSLGSTQSVRWKITGRYYNLNASQAQLGGKNFTGKIYAISKGCSSEDGTTVKKGYETILADNGGKTTIEAKTADFTTIETSNAGMYSYTEGTGKTYYYRGAVKNNYVSFAGFIWRIIRRNGDGSIRMIYSGKSTSDTGEDITLGKSAYNEKYWDPTYVGYKYNEDFSLYENNSITGYNAFINTAKYDFGTGYIFDISTRKFNLTGDIKQLTWKDNHDEIVKNNLYSCLNNDCNIVYKIVAYQSDTIMKVQPISYSSNNLIGTLANKNDSPIKKALDNWYKYNLINYNTHIYNSTYCNDRSIGFGSGYLISQNTTYGAYERLYSNSLPSLKCIQDTDKFSTTNENAKLDYPIALITADEIAYAGGVTDKENKKFYLYNGKNSYTISPSYFDSYWTLSHMFTLDLNGSLEIRKNLSNVYLIRPVINLKSDVTISLGDGTADAPYKIN